MAKVTALHASKPLPSLEDSISEQQTRAWRLRSLMECVSIAVECHRDDITDVDACFQGLIEYADGIHEALDPGVFTKQAGRNPDEGEPQ